MASLNTLINATKHMNIPMTFHLNNPNLPHILKSFGKYAIQNNYFIVHNLADQYRHLLPKLEMINRRKGENLWTIKSYQYTIMK